MRRKLRCSRGGAGRVALVGALLLAGCKPAGEAPGQGNAAGDVKPAPAKESALTEAIPLPEPALDREALLLAAVQAASASAGRIDDRATQSELAGRQFTLKIRFGCSGPAADAGGPSMSWSYDEAEETLKVRATLDLTHELPVIKSIAGEAFEAAEGFWIPRPWLFADACTAEGSAPAAQPAVRPGSVGIAQFFSESDSRVQRRSRRSFETVQRLDPESVPSAVGFNLVLTGRLKALPDGRVISCTSVEPNARPACVISSELDRVSFENAQTRTTVAEWGLG